MQAQVIVSVSLSRSGCFRWLEEASSCIPAQGHKHRGLSRHCEEQESIPGLEMQLITYRASQRCHFRRSAWSGALCAREVRAGKPAAEKRICMHAVRSCRSETPEQPCVRAEPACRYRNPIGEFDVTGREGTQMYTQKRKRL